MNIKFNQRMSWKTNKILAFLYRMENFCFTCQKYIFQITCVEIMSFHTGDIFLSYTWAYLWWHRERSVRWVQVKRLAAVAVGWYQLLGWHGLKLCEVAQRRVVKVRRLDALGVEGPPLVWKVTEGVKALTGVESQTVQNGSVGSFHLHKYPPY